MSYLKVAYEQYSCSSSGVNCIGDLSIIIGATVIVLGRDRSVLIDNEEQENLDSQPYHKGNITVKQVMQSNFLVETTGFVITFNIDGPIYITVDPYYFGIVCEHISCEEKSF